MQYLPLFLLAFAPLAAKEPSNIDRIYSHLTVGDTCSACDEALVAIQKNPKDKSLLEAVIKAMAKGGREQQMLSYWHSYISLYPEEKHNRHLLENMAWGVIEKGAGSPSPYVRFTSLIAAYIGQDARSVALLNRHFRDQNHLLRRMAVQLSSDYRDTILQEEVLYLSENDRDWHVRVEAIRALGKMKVEASKTLLLKTLSNVKLPLEERIAAIESLVYLIEAPSKSELKTLADSNRSGLRHLACRIVSNDPQDENYEVVFPLLKDNNALVRAAAVKAIALLTLDGREHEDRSSAMRELAEDLDGDVAITAGWALLREGDLKGVETLRKWVYHSKRDKRIAAAAALATTGEYGIPLMKETLKNSNDPYVKLNVAMGLVGQRKETDMAAQNLLLALQKNEEKWMKKSYATFVAIGPSDYQSHPMIPNFPEAMNQITRLEVLNILAVLEHPKAQEATEKFLSERTWGVSTAAAALLLSEGDLEAADIVEKQLNHPNKRIRVQAALILAMWGREEKALNILHEAYSDADHDLKEKILEGIANIGSQHSLSFLVDRLGEPHQTNRVIAAAAMIQCLYH